ncbi:MULTISPECIES: zinc-dependent alcohol dehydrogenase [Marinobacter]|jgi:threonine dehydrogenase-like Zn-dependent dehydrogenase|uniref:zinc-dependent alcohol dehydrogenase n=1 Tax=Marinobacter TaxID=2742 RepID=UPI0023565FBD|nr:MULTISPECIES: zinc-binding dehydrogenase [Marinobacter]
MKALCLRGPGRLDLQKVVQPSAGPDEVVINVEITGLGGSEVAAMQNPGFRPLPNIMGHGVCGTNEAGQRFAVYPLLSCQDCSFCQENVPQLCSAWALIGVQKPGGFAEKVVVPKQSLVALPTSLTWEQGAFIEPFANAVNAWEQAAPKPTDSILVIGAGSLGLGVIAIARDQGLTAVLVSEPSSSRRQAALQLGACEAARTIEGEFDVVFDTVGSDDARLSCMSLTRRNGKCVFLGFASPSYEIDFSRMIREQKTLIGSFVFSGDQFKKAIQLVEHCRSEWVRNLSFEEVAEELDAYTGGNYDPVKSALRPQW